MLTRSLPIIMFKKQTFISPPHPPTPILVIFIIKESCFCLLNFNATLFKIYTTVHGAETFTDTLHLKKKTCYVNNKHMLINFVLFLFTDKSSCNLLP